MGFVKGNTYGKGRPKGSLNQNRTLFQQALNKLLEDNAENMQGWLNKVAEESPEKAFRILKDFAEFVHPKLTRTEFVEEVEEPERDESKVSQEKFLSILTDEQLEYLAGMTDDYQPKKASI